MNIHGFNDVRVGDFVEIYDGKLYVNTSLVIGKNPKSKEIKVDDVFGTLKGKNKSERISWITECEVTEGLSRDTVYNYFMKIPHKLLPEKLWYLRLIKLNGIAKSINE